VDKILLSVWNIVKRDCFAMMAMQEIIHAFPSRKPVDIAITAFQYSDEMMKESSKVNKPPEAVK